MRYLDQAASEGLFEKLIELGDEVWKTLQERAYASPIWYTL